MNDARTSSYAGHGSALDQQVYRHVIGHFTSGVAIITARDGHERYGMTASAVTSLSLDPPMLIVCLNAASTAQRAVEISGRFVINILNEDQAALGERFAARHSPDKFDGVATTDGAEGQVFLDGVLATLYCHVSSSVTAATHRVFFANVVEAVAHDGAPLAYYRGQFGRFQMAHDDEVYRRLREMVLGGDSAILGPLDIDELAEQLDEPQSAVYYALTRLRGEGLVVRNDDNALMSVHLDPRLADEAWDAKMMIELGAAERSVGLVGAEDLAQLRRLADTVAEVAQGTYSVAEYQNANLAFHEFQVSLAGNGPLHDAYRRLSIRGAMLALRGTEYAQMDDYVGIDQHMRIVAGYEAGDIDAVRAAISAHSHRAKGYYRPPGHAATPVAAE